MAGEIGEISCLHDSVVLGGSSGTLTRYPVVDAQVFPQDRQSVQSFKLDGGIIAVSMDSLNNEGIVGTGAGSLYYINFEEKVSLKVVNTC